MIKKKDLKSFALIWAIIFFIIGIYPLFNSEQIKFIPLIISFLFFLTGILKPQILTMFYKIWMKIGEFIGGITSKIVLFILFFGLFTPASFVLKLLRKDLLNKEIDKSAESYWITRESQPESMKRQF